MCVYDVESAVIILCAHTFTLMAIAAVEKRKPLRYDARSSLPATYSFFGGGGIDVVGSLTPEEAINAYLDLAAELGIAPSQLAIAFAR